MLTVAKLRQWKLLLLVNFTEVEEERFAGIFQVHAHGKLAKVLRFTLTLPASNSVLDTILGKAIDQEEFVDQFFIPLLKCEIESEQGIPVPETFTAVFCGALYYAMSIRVHKDNARQRTESGILVPIMAAEDFASNHITPLEYRNLLVELNQ